MPEPNRRPVVSAASGAPLTLVGLAVVATTVMLGAIWTFAPVGSYLHDLFFERSWVQFVSTFVFWMTVVTLVHSYREFLREQAAYEKASRVLDGPTFSSVLTWSDADLVRRQFVDDAHGEARDRIAFRRIAHGLARLRNTQSTRAMEDYFKTRSEIDAGELDSSYADVRYFTWLLPTLGLLGTVLGIGRGIGGFAHIIQSAKGFDEIKSALPSVAGAFGTGFDTTWLALAYAALAVFFMSALLKRQELLLDRVDTLCVDRLCPLFQEHSTASEEIVQALTEKINLIIQRNNGNRAEIVDVIRRELPALIAERIDASVKTLAERLIATIGMPGRGPTGPESKR